MIYFLFRPRGIETARHLRRQHGAATAAARAGLGLGAPGAEVTVKFAGQTKSTRADADGKWLVKLGKLNASFDAANRSSSKPAKRKHSPTSSSAKSGSRPASRTWKNPSASSRARNRRSTRKQELAAANYPNLRIFQVDKMLVRRAAQRLGEIPRLAGMQFQCARLDSFFRRRVFLWARDSHQSECAGRSDRIVLGRHAHRAVDAAGRLSIRAVARENHHAGLRHQPDSQHRADRALQRHDRAHRRLRDARRDLVSGRSPIVATRITTPKCPRSSAAGARFGTRAISRSTLCKLRRSNTSRT